MQSRATLAETCKHPKALSVFKVRKAQPRVPICLILQNTVLCFQGPSQDSGLYLKDVQSKSGLRIRNHKRGLVATHEQLAASGQKTERAHES